MDAFLNACRFVERAREKSKVGVWGFGAVSRDVVLTLALEELGQEIVFYSRPKEGFGNRAGAWIDDFKANTIRRPRLKGTGDVQDMAGLDVIFVGVGVPRREGQSRDDLLAVNTEVIAKTTRQIADLYKGCAEENLPVLVYMGKPGHRHDLDRVQGFRLSAPEDHGPGGQPGFPPHLPGPGRPAGFVRQ